MKKWIAAILMVFMLCGACAQADHLAGQEAEDSGNIELARQLWEEAAAQGDAQAAFSLGYRYYSGKYGAVDYAKAHEYYVMAAELGHAKAQYNLGVFYRDGYGVEQDVQKALEWYQKAAEQGHGSAMNGIGYIYKEQGDYAAAMEWYLKAHDSGYEGLEGAECTNIGLLYEQGLGVEQDYQKAMEWFILGAQEGSEVSMGNIGILYQEGRGVEKDYAKAAQWWEKAIAQDPQYVRALDNLSWIYRQNEYGMTQDDEKARMYHERAAELGSEYVIGGLAYMTMEGIGGEKNFAEAIRLYEKLAANGDVESMRHIGWMYSEGGYGIETDDKAAFEWLLKAAELGDGWSMCRIGTYYNEGEVVEKNEQLGQEWKDKSTQHGHTHSN